MPERTRRSPGDEEHDLVYSLLEAAPSAVLGFDSSGHIDYVNDLALEMFGYTAEELLGRPAESLVPPRIGQRVHNRLASFFSTPRPRPMGAGPDILAVRKDGTRFPSQYSATPLLTSSGVWVVVAVEDMTVQRDSERRIELLSRSYLTLAKMNEAAVRARDEHELYAETCRVAFEHGGFMGAWVGQVDADRRVMPVASDGRLRDYIDALDIRLDPDVPTGRGPTATAYREQRAVYSSDFLADPITGPWHSAAGEAGIRASVSLPLVRTGRTVAVLSLYADDVDLLDAGMRELLEGLTSNVSFALEGFENERRLERIASQRRELLRRLVNAQESERDRIAADIHDESVQALAAVDLRLGLVRRQAQQTAPHLEPALDQMERVLTNASASLRQLLFNLEDPDTEAGLAATIREAAEHVFIEGRPRWHLQAEEVTLSPIHFGQAVRILKEALINVRKHAQAQEVQIVVGPQGEGVQFEVTDDGSGFTNDPATRVRGHRGLETMRERADMAGGWLRVEQPPEGGSSVFFWLPSDGDGLDA